MIRFDPQLINQSMSRVSRTFIVYSHSLSLTLAWGTYRLAIVSSHSSRQNPRVSICLLEDNAAAFISLYDASEHRRSFLHPSSLIRKSKPAAMTAEGERTEEWAKKRKPGWLRRVFHPGWVRSESMRYPEQSLTENEERQKGGRQRKLEGWIYIAMKRKEWRAEGRKAVSRINV